MLSYVLIALAAVVVTVVAMLLISNLTSGEKKVQHEFEHAYGVGDSQFTRSIGNLLGPPLLPGNRITAFHNGARIFPAMLEAIGRARKTITLETFIYWEGEVGERFAAALSERAAAGVRVHVLIDWLGSNRIDEKYIEKMEAAGVEVERYHPLRWYTIDRINNRTHRKIAVIDGRVAFTGGVGIADRWAGNAEDPEHWRDTHYLIEGPAVGQMQAAFMDNWVKTHSEVLHGHDYFPPLEQHGSCVAQIFKSSPREGSESMRLMFLMSLACATKTIRIGNAYFVPDDLLVGALVEARKRGVHVQIIVPGVHIDVQVVRRASRSRWGDLLEAGCEIYEYQPTMYHCKVLIVDGCWISVGSTNFDNRSLRLNDEANLNILDASFAAELTRVFEADLGRARQITHQEWLNRPLKEKVTERLAGLLRSQL